MTKCRPESGPNRGDAQLTGETIIYFGPEPWEGMWRNRHQLMSRLARNNQVVYVEPPVMLRPAIRRLAGARGRNEESSASRRIHRTDNGVVVYPSPGWTPLTGRAPFRNLALRLYFRMLKTRCGIEQHCRPIVWLSRPQMADYVGKLSEKLVIYHVVDEYTAYTGIDATTRAWLVQHEQTAMRRADAVIVVTQALLESKSPFNANTYLIPNAVNFAAYTSEDTDEPADLAGVARPIVGFTGLVSARLDLKLLIEAAHSKPEWSFVFVGAIDRTGCGDTLDTLDELDNVHFLGVKTVTSMPAYIQRFDVCTIPYARDESAKNASPLKLYEYAAVGRPIITTDFPAAREFPGHLDRVTDTAEFLDACERALDIPRSDRRLTANREYAARNTWDDRVRAISEIMLERLSEKSSP